MSRADPASGADAGTPVHDAAAARKRLRALAVGATGVVYGDVGTSPLYTLREAFGETGQLAVSSDSVFGVLSLIFWSVLIVVSGKYVTFILRADNRGQGGVMALTALAMESLGATSRRRGVLLVLGLIGAALFYGDSLITPAISVLSAVEGLEVPAPGLASFVVPAAVAVLVGLFMLQGAGTARVGALFGPVMLVWFATLGVLGLASVVAHPEILAAIDPRHAVAFCFDRGIGFHLFAPLSAVVLALTGAEALYEDLGHFGRKPIRLAWFAVVMPGLLLNYFGQGALIIHDPAAARAPFFLLAPSWAQYPLVGLSTLATIIASQAVISGTFSVTHQAMQLGFLPRLVFRHTSATEFGQIYMPNINWILMTCVVALVLGFQSSSHLAHAYGIAVTGTMLVGTILGYTVARYHWGWPRTKAVPLFLLFLIVDLAFFLACSTKIAAGGWVPLVVALATFVMIQAWREGRAEMMRYQEEAAMSLESFLARLTAKRAPRVAGTAIFMSASPVSVPSALLHNLKHNKVLHERVVLLNVQTEQVPTVLEAERITVETHPHTFYRVIARYGFMESPDVLRILEACARHGLSFDMMETSFFLGRDTVVPALRSRIPLWRERIFFWLWRNASSATDFFRIPPNRVIELGSQVEI
jgi:KUP system potassium uptake protein